MNAHHTCDFKIIEVGTVSEGRYRIERCRHCGHERVFTAYSTLRPEQHVHPRPKRIQ